MGQKVTHGLGSGTGILPLDLGWSEGTVTPSNPLIAPLHLHKARHQGLLALKAV